MFRQTIYDWPEYYDWTSDGLANDLTYYTDLAKQTGGPVLELGCGTGRVSLAIAREGIQVLGIDLSESMLKQAKKKSIDLGLSHQIQWMQANMTEFEVNQKFPLIIIPYRSFLHLTSVREQILALQRIRNHLMDDGLFAFNVFVPHLAEMVAMEDTQQFRGVFPIPGTEESVEIYDTTTFDHFYQLAYVTRYYERFSKEGTSIQRIKTSMKFRYIYPTELKHLLRLCGFCIVKRYGSFTREVFHRESKELIIEAKKCSIKERKG